MNDRPSVLFVCVANVCRSPLAQFFTQTLIASEPDPLQWSFHSAGTSAMSGAPLCDWCAEVLASAPGGEAFTLEHRAQPLTVELVADADLILTATSRERADVALLAPDARERTFTLREAEHLLRSGQGSDVQAGRELASLLHNRRGLSVPPALTGRRSLIPAQNRGRGGLDIPDAHQSRRANHATVYREVRSATTVLAAAMAGNRSPAT